MKDSLGVLAALVILVATNVSTALFMNRRSEGLLRDLAGLRASDAETRKLLEEKGWLVKALERERRDLQDALGNRPIPSIDARVAQVKGDVTPSLVLLSAGSDDKVERGFHFSVYRGSNFVGKVVVEKVLKDSCGCRVLFTKEGETIQLGDCAATRLQ